MGGHGGAGVQLSGVEMQGRQKADKQTGKIQMTGTKGLRVWADMEKESWTGKKQINGVPYTLYHT
jgi:hypothetical protein